MKPLIVKGTKTDDYKLGSMPDERRLKRSLGISQATLDFINGVKKENGRPREYHSDRAATIAERSRAKRERQKIRMAKSTRHETPSNSD